MTTRDHQIGPSSSAFDDSGYAPEPERCSKRHPGLTLRCVLPKGHEGDHDTGTSVPPRPAPSTPPADDLVQRLTRWSEKPSALPSANVKALLAADVRALLERLETAEREDGPATRQQVHALAAEGDFCCLHGCGNGGCEMCPCCWAGWCVMGTDELPTDPEDLARWLEVAAEHNPVARALAQRDATLAAVRSQADACDELASEPLGDDTQSALRLAARGIRAALETGGQS